MQKELLFTNFLMSKKDIFIESKYYALYDTFLSEAVDDEFSESIDVYSSFNEELDCYMIDVDVMIQEAIFYSIYYDLYDTDKSYDMYDLSILVLNETVRIYNALFIHDYSILIRMISNIDAINATLYEELIYYNENYK